METIRLDGKALAKTLRKEVRERAQQLRALGIAPRLDVVLVGDDPASQAYVATKERLAGRCRIESRTHRLAADTPTEQILDKLAELQADPELHGLLVQLPLPGGQDAEAVIDAIDPSRDVDGLTPHNLGLLCSGRPAMIPCTPAGILALLDRCAIPLEGQRAVVIGRSLLAGRTMGQLLLDRNATVTYCHSRTRDLRAEVGRADLLVVAIGRPQMIHGSWLKPGAVVVDVGINRLDDGRLVGDVDFDSAQGIASAITPVPGGVGAMTTAMLLHNTVEATLRRAGVELPAPAER